MQAGASNIREHTPNTFKEIRHTVNGWVNDFNVNRYIHIVVDLLNPYIWVVLIITIGYGLIGLLDDYLKLKKRDLSGKLKLFLQILFAGWRFI